jgi:hypothetical protein
MPLDWEQVVVDSKDPQALGRWWADALDWVITIDSHEEFEIRSTPESTPGMIFTPVEEGKTAKNRLHLDFRPQDQETEVNRLLAMGARLADIGHGQQPWVVLLDPEGNEFDILNAQAPDTRQSRLPIVLRHCVCTGVPRQGLTAKPRDACGQRSGRTSTSKLPPSRVVALNRSIRSKPSDSTVCRARVGENLRRPNANPVEMA